MEFILTKHAPFYRVKYIGQLPINDNESLILQARILNMTLGQYYLFLNKYYDVMFNAVNGTTMVNIKDEYMGKNLVSLLNRQLNKAEEEILNLYNKESNK